MSSVAVELKRHSFEKVEAKPDVLMRCSNDGCGLEVVLDVGLSEGTVRVEPKAVYVASKTGGDLASLSSQALRDLPRCRHAK